MFGKNIEIDVYNKNLCVYKKIVFARIKKIFYLRSSKQEKLTFKHL